METRLTITLDETLIDRAKVYATRHKVTLTKLIEDYVEALAQREGEQTEKTTLELDPLVESLYGIATLPSQIDDKEAYYDHLIKKYDLKNAS